MHCAAAPGSHRLALYDDDEQLASSVVGHLLPAFGRGQPVVVVATAAHRRLFAARLAAAGADVRGARLQGRYVELDADETLALFMVDGVPDRTRFAEAVGAPVAALIEAHGPVAVYGEMVVRLWEGGSVAAAVALEDLWNDLGDALAFALLCAYPAALHAGADDDVRAVLHEQHHGRPGAEPAAPAGRAPARPRAAPAPTRMPVLPPDATFEAASTLVLDYLREQLPMSFWSVTRVENGRQTYLHLGENGYGLAQGDSHPWEDSYCIHMSAGRGPTVARDAQSVPAYRAARINRSVPIGAYAGSAIHEPDGALFGALCGLDPQVDAAGTLVAAEPVLALLGQMLTVVLAAERARDAVTQQALEMEVAADTDSLTGLHNRRAWERLLEEESLRVAHRGDPTILVVLDLDHLKAVNDGYGHAAGDRYLQRAAWALRRGVRACDSVARIGGDEFGVLLRGCSEQQAGARVVELDRRLVEHSVSSSLGWAPLTVQRGLPAAVAEADAAMYRAKRARRALDPVDLQRFAAQD